MLLYRRSACAGAVGCARKELLVLVLVLVLLVLLLLLLHGDLP